MKWSYEKCKNIALGYKTKKEFRKEYQGTYLYAIRNNIIDDVCIHMKPLGNKYKRCIYLYEFPDNYVYIGLTYNLNKRNNEHITKYNSAVYNHIKRTGSFPILTQITDYIDANESIIIEDQMIREYKNNGYNILNKAKAGALGGVTMKWTKMICIDIAREYKTTKDFKINQPNAYYACIRNKWLREVCSHIKIVSPNKYWTKELCLEKALEYKNKKEFKSNSNDAYIASCRNGWLDDICTHMILIIKPKGYWTKENCLIESLKFSKRKEFSNNSPSAYNIARKNGWLNDICTHMK